VVSRWY